MSSHKTEVASPWSDLSVRDVSGDCWGVILSILTVLEMRPCWRLLLKMPRACPVEVSRSLLCSFKREPPRDKPVASRPYFLSSWYSSDREDSTGQARGILIAVALGILFADVEGDEVGQDDGDVVGAAGGERQV